MQSLKIDWIFLILFIILTLSNSAEAGVPVVSISASVNSSEIISGNSGMLTVVISETGGYDLIENPTVIIKTSPAEGISFTQTSETVSKIDKSSSNTFYFIFNTEKTVSPGKKNIYITLQYYETDHLNFQYYITYNKYSVVSFNIIPPPVGSLNIISTPSGTEVFLDETYKGITPITIPSISTGSHTVSLKKSGYNEIFKTVDVKNGQTAYLSDTLIRQTGSINFSSDPNGAEVYFNGTYKGVTPINISNVPIGTYSVVLKKFGYADWTQIVNIRADSVIEINPSMELQYLMFLGFTIIAIFLILGAALRKHIPKENTTKANEIPKPVAVPYEEPDSKSQAVLIEKPKEPLVEKPKESCGISAKSAYEYRGAKIYYKIKIENDASETIGDIKVHLFVPDVFLLAEKEKAISMLETKESKTVTFEIRPTGECGECNVSGKIEYYDYATKGRKMLDIENKSLSVICPILKRKEISMQQWEKVTDELIKAEEKIKELSAPAENLFNITSRVIKDNGMFMFKPEITSTPSLFNGLAMFYAEGVTGYRYAAYMEVVGGARKSRMILKVWAEKEEALIGFYHRILDDIEKRIDVKIFIDDAIVQQHIHIGDRIGTQVKDSFVQRSTIGAGARKCPKCSREVEANEKFCNECGARL